MPSDELLNARLALGVEVLKLVHGGELFHIQTVRSHDIYKRKTSQSWEREKQTVRPYNGCSSQPGNSGERKRKKRFQAQYDDETV